MENNEDGGEQQGTPDRHDGAAHLMSEDRTEYPPFSWSYTRDRMLGACERRYFWHYYGGHNGWEVRAPADARTAWRLKHLTTYAQELGSAIHERAQEIAVAVRDGSPRPSGGLLYRRTRNALEALRLRCKSVDRFVQDPKRHSVTQQAYYGRPIPRDRLMQLGQKMRLCLAHLAAHSLWAELGAASRAGVLRLHVFTHTPSFLLDDTVVYAQPDLVFHTPVTGWVVVDWKTGFAEGTGDQMAVYCLLARAALPAVAAIEQFECRVVHLAAGRTDVGSVGPADLERCATQIRARVSGMRQLLADAALNKPEDRSHFALTANRRRCGSCNFLELCREELAVGEPPALPLEITLIPRNPTSPIW